MSEFQFGCLVIVLVTLSVLLAYSLWRVKNLQYQIDMVRSDQNKMIRRIK